MTEKEQKLLNESLSKLFKMDSETVASLYNEAGELSDFSRILELDRERIQKYKEENDNQYRRGIKEGAQKIEKAIKEKYEVDSDLQGVDLVDHLVVTKTEEVKSASSKDITKHPDYIKLQLSVDKQLKERDTQWQSKLDNQAKEIAAARLFEKVSKRALANLKSRNPIMPQDPRKAQAWEEIYLGELRKHSYMEDSDGNPIVLNAEGTPLTSPHGKNITFDEFEKEVADRYFEYPVAGDRSSAGNKGIDGAGSSGFATPKTEEEYMTRLKDPKITPAERIKLTDFWMSKK